MKVELAYTKVSQTALGLSRDDWRALRVAQPLTANDRKMLNRYRPALAGLGLDVRDVITEELDELIHTVATVMECDCTPGSVHWRDRSNEDWLADTKARLAEIRARRA